MYGRNNSGAQGPTSIFPTGPYGGPCINVIHPAYPSCFHPQILVQCRSSPHTLQIESPRSTHISRYSLLLRFVRRPLFSLLSPHYLEFRGVTYTQTSPLSQPHVLGSKLVQFANPHLPTRS